MRRPHVPTSLAYAALLFFEPPLGFASWQQFFDARLADIPRTHPNTFVSAAIPSCAPRDSAVIRAQIEELVRGCCSERTLLGFYNAILVLHAEDRRNLGIAKWSAYPADRLIVIGAHSLILKHLVAHDVRSEDFVAGERIRDRAARLLAERGVLPPLPKNFEESVWPAILPASARTLSNTVTLVGQFTRLLSQKNDVAEAGLQAEILRRHLRSPTMGESERGILRRFLAVAERCIPASA